MKLEDQVLTIEQAQHLQELGMDMSDAALCWGLRYFDSDKLEVIINFRRGEHPSATSDTIPTYTLQEILEKLPKYFGSLKLDIKNCSVCYRSSTTGKMVRGYRSFALDGLFNGAYKLLCWVLENGFKEDEK